MKEIQKTELSFVINPKKIFIENAFENGLILLEQESGHCFYLNASATHLWALLKSKSTLTTLIQCLERHFSLSATDAKKDISDWLANLTSLDMIKETQLANTTQAQAFNQHPISNHKSYEAPSINHFELLKDVAGGDGNVAESTDGVLLAS